VIVFTRAYIVGDSLRKSVALTAPIIVCRQCMHCLKSARDLLRPPCSWATILCTFVARTRRSVALTNATVPTLVRDAETQLHP
jgi:hypothetical protein